MHLYEEHLIAKRDEERIAVFNVPQTGSMEHPYLRNTSPLRELFHKRILRGWGTAAKLA